MKLAFFAESCLPIHARSLEERPLGGTETALIRLAETLSGRGQQVSIFSADPNASRHNSPKGPQYLPGSAVFSQGIFDVFVCVKDYRPAVRGAPGKRLFYWTGDGFDQFINFGLGDKRVSNKIEKFFAVSSWHKSSLCQASGFPESQTTVIYNGVHLEHFQAKEVRQPKRLIYTAAPYRGLTLLQQIFPALKARHPELELHIFSGLSVYDTDRPFAGPLQVEYERLKQSFSRMTACYFHGNVTQERLAKELLKSAVFVYPNTIFETCCITALEAQAAGCPVVASDNSALPETVGEAGFVIPGQVGSQEYLLAFIEAVDRLISSSSLWQEKSQAGLRRVREFYNWEKVADRFLAALG